MNIRLVKQSARVIPDAKVNPEWTTITSEITWKAKYISQEQPPPCLNVRLNNDTLTNDQEHFAPEFQ